MTASGLEAGTIDIEFLVEVSNTGVAPFYYPLTLHLGDGVDKIQVLSDDLHTLQPGETRTLSLTIQDVDPKVLNDSYSLSLSSPILLGEQVIRFADQGDQAGVISLNPSMGCAFEDAVLDVGELRGDCFCDVDGQWVNGQAEACD